jgi:hypothetical protein
MKSNDPNDLLPIVKASALGLGVDSADALYRLFAAHPPAPPVLKIAGKNVIRRADRDAFRDRLISAALRQAIGGTE